MPLTELYNSQVLALVGAWLFYFLIHSLLASLRVKRLIAAHWPGVMPVYRLLFNLGALLLLAPPIYFTFQLKGPWLWRWSDTIGWFTDGLALISVALFYWTSRYYDSSEFIGLKQWRKRFVVVEDQERFHLSPLHRFVRHPWYLLALVFIWSRDMTPALLVTALLATLYFWLGSRLEEYKLIIYHGDVYCRYRERVPGLLPRPWRYLSREDAEELQRYANSG